MRTLNTLLLTLLVACGGGEAPANKPGEPAKTPVATPAPATVAPPAANAGRKVTVTISDKGYDPASIEANPEEPLTLVFERPAAGGCGEEVVFPSTGEKLAIAVGEKKEIAIKAPKSGELAFTCGMNMYQGKIVVAGG